MTPIACPRAASTASRNDAHQAHAPAAEHEADGRCSELAAERFGGGSRRRSRTDARSAEYTHALDHCRKNTRLNLPIN